MRTVRDDSGNRYLVEKESGDSALVRDPATGERRHVPTDRLEAIDDESPLETVARVVPDPVRRAVTAVHDDRALGLLVEVDRRGPVGVRALLASTECCESELHGLLAEFRAARLVAEADVAGERGYETTGDGEAAVAVLTGGDRE
jgi:hypothetical protein